MINHKKRISQVYIPIPRPKFKPKFIPKKTAMVAYDYLFKVRDLDNQLMWTRSNTVLIIQGGIFGFLTNQFDAINKHPGFLLYLSFFGVVSAVLSLRIIIGGSYWVTYWEKQLEDIEHNVTGNVGIFRKDPMKNSLHISARGNFINLAKFIVVIWSVLVGYAIWLLIPELISF